VIDLPRFEVTTPATLAGRRLTTALKVTNALKIAAGTDTSLIEEIIDGVSGECARYCRLARPSNWATPPTFGQEVCKATWLTASCERGTRLMLPWRVAISAFGQVVENGTNLTVNTDYQLLGGNLLERISSDTPIRWSSGKIVAPFTAGWSLPSDVPAELERQVIEQVKMLYLTTDRDRSLRSEAEPDLYSASYGVAGGDTIHENGMLRSLVAALGDLRDEAVV
jgi:hypothetical protein